VSVQAVRITQLDGKLPNLALMRIAHHHRALGHEVHFTRSPYRHLYEGRYDAVYGSAIFDYSRDHVSRLKAEFPGVILGGTGSGSKGTVEALGIGYECSYADYPAFDASIGYTQRGCRLSCKFCVVPGKEGKPRSVASVAEIWRGIGHPRHIHLLDNDFFGQPEATWRSLIDEMVDGRFKVCFNQGINVRFLTAETAAALARVDYRDDSFEVKRLYTAWDNLKDEEMFFRGVRLLEDVGVRPSHLMAYMLVGFDKKETWSRLFYRFNRMVELGIRPYPMVIGDRMKTLPLGGHNAPIERRTLGEFQRWVIRKAYTFIPFEHYDVNARGHSTTDAVDLFSEVSA
jgi:hypothetical protein